MRPFLLAVGGGAILIAAYNGLRAAAHVKPGAPQSQAFTRSPPAEIYTAEGRRYHRRAVAARTVFLVTLIAYVVLGLLGLL